MGVIRGGGSRLCRLDGYGSVSDLGALLTSSRFVPFSGYVDIKALGSPYSRCDYSRRIRITDRNFGLDARARDGLFASA